jgi:hypothetical protein
MPANSAQCLAGHVASSTSTAQLDASDVIFKTEQLQFTAIVLHSRSNGFKRALNYVQILFCGRHIFPFTRAKEN